MVQIVIDIPEEVYNLISGKIDVANIDLYSTLISSVKNGTPLPKGHGRLIDADALTYKQTHHGNYCTPFELIDRNRLNNAPTIIEADNKEKQT